MELEFDKEIDALIRGRGVSVGDSPEGHLDADEISAFAENALPERTRALHMSHIADCDRCRKTLSNLIALNNEAEPEKAAAAVPALPPAAVAVPWYRKLFLFPNLAYVMGGLVLMIGALIGLSVYQGSLGDGAVTSQITESEAVRGPMAPTDSEFSATANTAGNTNAMSNTATTGLTNANTASIMPVNTSNTSAAAVNAPARANGDSAAPRPAPNTADVAVASDADAPAMRPAQPPAAPPAAMAEAAPPKDVAVTEDDTKARIIQENEKKKAASRTARNMEDMSVDGLSTQNRARTQAGGIAKATPGPTRDMQQTFPNRADNTYELRSRRVGGKDFQFRSGAWYDTAYRQQGTTNVRRGSDEYRKLDPGLRSITENLGGVVVVVWGGKAYRIQ